MGAQPRKPRAVRLDAEAPERVRPGGRRQRGAPEYSIEAVPDEAAHRLPAEPPALAVPTRRQFPWVATLVFAAGALVSLAAGMAIDRLIADLFARNDWLGWLALFFAGLLLFALTAIVLREIRGLLRLRSIATLRRHAVAASASDDAVLARRVIGDLTSLYSNRPDTASGRAALAEHDGEIIDGGDLVRLAERDLLAPLDRVARGMVMSSAKRVSVVTAVSPRALVDVIYVLVENLRLIRRLSELYGGNPGTLGFWRLTRNVVAHLAATGAISIGDGLIQQVVGHGLAARLSARLGEGVVNGLLTARIGLAAIDLCRPVPFIHEPRPKISGFLSELSRLSGISTKSEATRRDRSAPQDERRDNL
jgi:putative membrane protein